MSGMIAAVEHAVEAVVQALGTDVLASLTGLAIVVLFLYIEGGKQSRPSH